MFFENRPGHPDPGDFPSLSFGALCSVLQRRQNHSPLSGRSPSACGLCAYRNPVLGAVGQTLTEHGIETAFTLILAYTTLRRASHAKPSAATITPVHFVAFYLGNSVDTALRIAYTGSISRVLQPLFKIFSSEKVRAISAGWPVATITLILRFHRPAPTTAPHPFGPRVSVPIRASVRCFIGFRPTFGCGANLWSLRAHAFTLIHVVLKPNATRLERGGRHPGRDRLRPLRMPKALRRHRV